jgi:hypothetical protein
MRIPSGQLLLWAMIQVGISIFALIKFPAIEPRFQPFVALLATWSAAVALLLFIQFRWSPELLASGYVALVGFGVFRMVEAGVTVNRLGMIAGPILVLAGYPSLRREVRGLSANEDEDLQEIDDPTDDPSASLYRSPEQKADADLGGETCQRIVAYHGATLDVAELLAEERNVLLTYNAKGYISNGGFNYLFEVGVPGDPHYDLTAAAFEEVGSEAAARAFRKALKLFPGSRPPTDMEERLRVYRQGDGAIRNEIDSAFFDAGDELDRCLARYIRAHRQAFAHLDGVACERPGLDDMVESVKTGRKRYIEEQTAGGLNLAELPHWARVAFAARSARIVLPVFITNWPEPPKRRLNALLRAIELAERSAVAGRPEEELKDAELEALGTAGAALMKLYGYPTDEPGPPDGNMAAAAAEPAKSAEHAARAAASAPNDSLEPALEAYDWAKGATSKRPDLAIQLNRDLARILELAKIGRWTDETPVPSNTWEKE